MPTPSDPEAARLREDQERLKNWKRWGPYLSERQWATVREDYSNDGSVWTYFPHDHARSRAYRWGEDGILGITDRECRLCFSLAFWNHQDPILKERMFGLTGPEGNHGEDVKELYYYLDSTPTHSYFRGLYKYPQRAYPYEQLLEESRRRGRNDPTYGILDTGIFNENRYFDIQAEYAKAAPDDILIRLTIHNRGPESAPLLLLPTLWFRNTWSWGADDEQPDGRPEIHREGALLHAAHASLETFFLAAEPLNGAAPEIFFTENETNFAKVFGGLPAKNQAPYVKDAFHQLFVHGDKNAVNTASCGTKAAFAYQLEIPPGDAPVIVRLRLTDSHAAALHPLHQFDALVAQRRHEADTFFGHHVPLKLSGDVREIARQAYGGLLWSKQFYHYVVEQWLTGDPKQPPPPPGHAHTRNTDWPHLYSRDVLLVPDNWEYPWFAAWDLAFHAVAMARVDADYAKGQLELLLREWYMHPNGQIPAYEFEFSDVNPPVHAWAAWRVYKMTAPRGKRDVAFLERCFHKLMLNFTWWVNRKDIAGRHLFSGGFLGLDNIGVFDRSRPLPTGHYLEQADGTAWMAFYCSTMLAIALELSAVNNAYEDIASKFFEHFVAIVDAMNTFDGTGLWDERDGFYYDHLRTNEGTMPLRLRSLVGLVPLFGVEVFERETLEKLPGFMKRMQWFLEHRGDLAKNISYMEPQKGREREGALYLLAVPSRERLERVLAYLFDEGEFLSPFGTRSLSKVYKDHPFSLELGGESHVVRYAPGEADTGLFGGNSNWRGPVWMPMNFLLIEALERYDHFYGERLKIEYPNGSGNRMTLGQIVADLRQRVVSLFLRDKSGRRPCMGEETRYVNDPNFRELVLFHEYFHAENGKGLGAAHQTGWTALVAQLLADQARNGKLT